MIGMNIESRKRKADEGGHPLQSREGDLKVYSYKITGPKVKGKFDVDKAKKLNIPKGNVRSKLVNGESVVIDGKVIVPEDVCFPEKPGYCVYVIDCISLAQIIEILLTMDIDKSACVVYHLGDPEIIQSPEYKEFIGRFNDLTHHIYFPSSNDVTFKSSHQILCSLNYLDERVYPVCEFEPEKTLENEALCNQTFELEPIRKPGQRGIPKFDLTKTKLKLKNNTVIDNIKETFDCVKSSGFEDGSFFNIKFLGTGSMIPSKYRNVSSIAITTPGANILFDAGEGTLGQIKRLYGINYREIFLKDLKVVFLSHMHADHQLGLLSVILEWSKSTELTSLSIVAPQAYFNSLSKISEIVDIPMERLDFIRSSGRDIRLPLVGLKIRTAKVPHSEDSYACFVSEDTSKEVLIYSGDAAANDIIKNVADSHYKEHKKVLIHECTYSDDFRKEADERKHSTFSDAIDCAVGMKADLVLLTHFSQRFPVCLDMAAPEGLYVCGAVDGMIASLGRKEKLGKFGVLFSEKNFEEKIKLLKDEINS
jgi:ribonuclease Z